MGSAGDPFPLGVPTQVSRRAPRSRHGAPSQGGGSTSRRAGPSARPADDVRPATPTARPVNADACPVSGRNAR